MPRCSSSSTRRARCWRPQASGEPTRFDRARDEAIELQDELAGVPIGIASFTDRVLPHLFPTVDQRVFRETMREADRNRASAAIDVVRHERHDARRARCRADPELLHARREEARARRLHRRRQPAGVERARDGLLAKKPRVDVTFVRMGDASERIYASGVAEAGIRTGSHGTHRESRGGRHCVRGRVLDEGQVDEAAAAVLEALGTGPTVDRRIEGSSRALMPFVALLALLPLGFVLLRRNL